MSQHLISTRTQTQTCPGCQAPLLVALDEGEPARADATPITIQQEIAVLLDNRRTYTHTQGRSLIHRTPERIRSGWPTGTIHPAHKCPTPTLM